MADNRSGGRGGDGDGEIHSVIAFIKRGREGKPVPKNCGWAKKKGDKWYLTLEVLPVPGSGWEQQLVIEPQREDAENDGRGRSAPRNDDRGRDRERGRDDRR
jgi:hypothetical protein